MHKGNLLTLLPPYFSTCVIESCERWMFLYLSLWCVQSRNCIHDCVFLVVQKNVWLSVMFVKRNKSHKMDHNCKTLYVFRGKLCWFSVGRKKRKEAVMWQIQRCKARWRSVMWVLREPLSHYRISFQTVAFYLLFFFSLSLSSPGLCFILCMKSAG